MEPVTQTAKKEDALPLPSFLTKIYYIFPIVLYIPDVIFNFYVYSDGTGLDASKFGVESLPAYALWGFLATGIVGMAWLCSVLAPWHWAKHNYFQSAMCWLGAFTATAITIWNSLAYRSLKFVSFTTDKWFADTFHVSGVSPTMILVAVAPPFWGLFWAIVQPVVGKRSMSEAQEDHQRKLERLKQEAEVKRLKAETNAQIREAQIKGLSSTLKAAQAQITGKPAESQSGSVTVTEQPSGPMAALPEGRVVDADSTPIVELPRIPLSEEPAPVIRLADRHLKKPSTRSKRAEPSA